MTRNEASSVARLLIAGVTAISMFLAGCSQERPQEPAEQAAKPPAEVKPVPEPPPEVKPEPAKPEPAKLKERTRPSTAALMTPSKLTEKAPETYTVNFDTTKGNIKIQVTRAWAPLGADRFYNLVKSGYYDGCRFFRVVPNFVVQFGMHGDPKIGGAWQDANLKDDPVTKTNRKGALTFAHAGPGTRTTQIFINLKANTFLDTQGFPPFGEVTEGMEVVDSLYSGYGESPDQGMIRQSGNAYLERSFPNLDYIKKATIES